MSDNKIMQVSTAIPATVTNIKENTENNFNISNSSVTVNVTVPQQISPSSDAERILAMSRFSHEYYQLLVSTEEDIFETGVISFPRNRALNQYNVPPEILERCSSLENEGIQELKTFPALICRENRELYGKASPDEIGFLGYIKKVQKTSREIKVVFNVISPIHHAVLCDKKNAVYFDLDMDSAITSLTYTAWSVHKTDLFEALDEAGVSYPKLK